METFAAIVSIGGLLKGLRVCYQEIRDMRSAWRHGPTELNIFYLRVKLFKKALAKVGELIRSDPEHANDIRKLGHHILRALKNFLQKFQKLSPKLKYSKTARALATARWYLLKKTADLLLGTISRGEVSLNLWVSVDMVQSKEKRIKALEDRIRRLELEGVPVAYLQDIVYINIELRREQSELKSQCRARIKEIKALQRAHKEELREQRDRGSAEATETAMAMASRFASEIIEHLTQENAVVLELHKKHRRNSSAQHFSHSGSNPSSHRNKRASTERGSSRPTSHAKNESHQVEPVSNHVPQRREPTLRSVEVDPSVESLHSREVQGVPSGSSRVSSINCSPFPETSEIGDIEIVEENTPLEEGLELQACDRENEQQSHEDTEMTFYDLRRQLVEEAEARFAGRPKARENARKSQSRKLKRSTDHGHSPGNPNSSAMG